MTEVKNNPKVSNLIDGTHTVVYRLHKNNSPVVTNCYSEIEQTEVLQKCIKDGYKKAFRATPEYATKVLYDFDNQFEPKPLTKQERWANWALGKSSTKHVNDLESYSDEVKKLRKQMLRR